MKIIVTQNSLTTDMWQTREQGLAICAILCDSDGVAYITHRKMDYSITIVRENGNHEQWTVATSGQVNRWDQYENTSASASQRGATEAALIPMLNGSAFASTQALL